MPANFTRRRDLFLDAGFSDAEQAIALLYEDAEQLGLVGTKQGVALGIEQSMERAAERVDTMLSAPVRHLLDAAPEWIFERGGDLATLLWLARNLDQSEKFHLGALVFGLASRMWQRGFRRETAAMIRFLVAVDFDYGALYQEAGIAYGFFQPRDPNPLAWKLLDHVETRAQNMASDRLEHLHVLELGCGIGNDALGLLSSLRTASYVGCDISRIALDEHLGRVKPLLDERPQLAHSLIEGDFVSALADRKNAMLQRLNLIYSYSSLHYFSSGELAEIFKLVHEVLEAGVGLFCFAIKGKGSIWDGEGTALYRPDVWINYDGQSRWFPSRTSLAAMIDRHGFEILLHEWHEHWGYSEHGKRDLFHYVICSPRA
ncbi:MAG: class I SAM-dependent methyltransferase [Bradymonadaceae bacterium]|nr:class I SAM-dependent methyltransferase [Lujinxingiaceae bacterium]